MWLPQGTLHHCRFWPRSPEQGLGWSLGKGHLFCDVYLSPVPPFCSWQHDQNLCPAKGVWTSRATGEKPEGRAIKARITSGNGLSSVPHLAHGGSFHFTLGELWVLHRLAGLLGPESLHTVHYSCNQRTRENAEVGSQCEHVTGHWGQHECNWVWGIKVKILWVSTCFSPHLPSFQVHVSWRYQLWILEWWVQMVPGVEAGR